MRTQEIKVYKYSELSDKAKEKARNYFIEHRLDDNDYADLEFHKERLEERGFISPKISWSGFCSQGDGASFTCEYIDLAKYIEFYKLEYKQAKIIKTAWEKGWLDSLSISRCQSRYYHENTMIIHHNTYFKKDNDKIDTMVENFFKDVLSTAKQEARKIYKMLEESYNSCTSDEYISQQFDGNDIEFTSDGNIFKG